MPSHARRESLVKQGYLLRADADAMIEQAKASDILNSVPARC